MKKRLTILLVVLFVLNNISGSVFAADRSAPVSSNLSPAENLNDSSIFRVVLPANCNFIIDPYEIKNDGSMIISSDFAIINKGAMPINVDLGVNLKAIDGSNIQIKPRKSDIDQNSTEKQIWFAIATPYNIKTNVAGNLPLVNAAGKQIYSYDGLYSTEPKIVKKVIEEGNQDDIENNIVDSENSIEDSENSIEDRENSIEDSENSIEDRENNNEDKEKSNDVSDEAEAVTDDKTDSPSVSDDERETEGNDTYKGTEAAGDQADAGEEATTIGNEAFPESSMNEISDEKQNNDIPQNDQVNQPEDIMIISNSIEPGVTTGSAIHVENASAATGGAIQAENASATTGSAIQEGDMSATTGSAISITPVDENTGIEEGSTSDSATDIINDESNPTEENTDRSYTTEPEETEIENEEMDQGTDEEEELEDELGQEDEKDNDKEQESLIKYVTLIGVPVYYADIISASGYFGNIRSLSEISDNVTTIGLDQTNLTFELSGTETFSLQDGATAYKAISDKNKGVVVFRFIGAVNSNAMWTNSSLQINIIYNLTAVNELSDSIESDTDLENSSEQPKQDKASDRSNHFYVNNIDIANIKSGFKYYTYDI